MKDLMENWREFQLKEHKGVACQDKKPSARKKCEKVAQEKAKIRTAKRKKKRELHPGKEEMDALSRGVVRQEEKKKKPDCEPRNKQHDSQGRFSSTKNARSWSGSNPEGKTDCQHGQWQMKGTPKKLMTKVRCGRDEDGRGKAKWRCKDKSKVYQEEQEEWVRIRKSDLDNLLNNLTEEQYDNLLVEPLDEVKHNLSPQAIQQFCNDNAFYSFNDYLKKINAIELAQQGDLTAAKK